MWPRRLRPQKRSRKHRIRIPSGLQHPEATFLERCYPGAPSFVHNPNRKKRSAPLPKVKAQRFGALAKTLSDVRIFAGSLGAEKAVKGEQQCHHDGHATQLE